MKSKLAGAGEGGSCYYDWKPFSARELRQHFGLYLFNGLAPSPRVEQKFKPQSQDPVHGNEFIYHTFGPNSERCHRRFKTFLAIQDSAISTPSRKKYPNWKPFTTSSSQSLPKKNGWPQSLMGLMVHNCAKIQNVHL